VSPSVPRPESLVAPAEQASPNGRSLKTNFSAARNTERATQRPGLRARPFARPSRRSCAVSERPGARRPLEPALPRGARTPTRRARGTRQRLGRTTPAATRDWTFGLGARPGARASLRGVQYGGHGGRGCGPNTTEEFSLRRPGNLKVRPVFGASGAGAVLDDEHAAVRVDRAAAVKRGAVDDDAPTPTPAPCSSACCGRVCRS